MCIFNAFFSYFLKGKQINQYYFRQRKQNQIHSRWLSPTPIKLQARVWEGVGGVPQGGLVLTWSWNSLFRPSSGRRFVSGGWCWLKPFCKIRNMLMLKTAFFMYSNSFTDSELSQLWTIHFVFNRTFIVRHIFKVTQLITIFQLISLNYA